MDHWQKRVALVTGASVGIGAAICRELLKNGMIVVGCARNIEQIQKIAEENEIKSSPGSLKPIRCDLSKESDILNMFEEIENTLGRIDVCINNAGVSYKDSSLINGTTESWKNTLNVNILALCICTRESLKLMMKKGINDGQIIHISSMSGHRVVTGENGMTGFYSGTKHMVKGLAEALRQELRTQKSTIRVGCISPGMVVTEFLPRLLEDSDTAKEKYKQFKMLEAQDIAKAVIGILTMPSHVDINDILIRPTEQLI